jgi:hypothetical protein
MMTIRDRLEAAGRYLLARLQEPSTWKGLVLIVSALGWAELDGSSKGEALMQGGLLLIGVLNAAMPQKTLYRDGNDRG